MSATDRSRTGNRAAALGLIAVAIACVGLAIFYITVKSSFLASHYGHQPKHAVVFGGLAVLALVAANVVWRRRP